MNEITIADFMLNYLKDIQNVDNLFFMGIIIIMMYRARIIKFKNVWGSQITKKGLKKTDTGAHPVAPQEEKEGCPWNQFESRCEPRFDKIDKKMGNGGSSSPSIHEEIVRLYSEMAVWKTAMQLVVAHILKNDPDIVLDKRSKDLLNID